MNALAKLNILGTLAMSSRSLAVAPPCIKQVKAAMKRTGCPSQQALATELGLSRPTVNNFLNGRPIDRLNFIEICEKLGLSWQAIAHLNDSPDDIPPLTNTHRDFGDAPDCSFFCGREAERAILEQWILQENCRLIALIGMGGIGKTALSVRLAQQIGDRFEYVIWRSLRNAPPVSDTLITLIRFLSNPPQINYPESLDAQISRLIECLRASRCLVILDNAESILIGGNSGQYRQGCEGYGELVKRIGETPHRSCLIITSREKPRELAALEGEKLPARSLPLKGLQAAEGQVILKAKGLSVSSTTNQVKELSDRSGGNPLVLKIVAATIQDLFDGNVEEFLKQKTLAFDDIRAILDQQINPLFDLEKQIMYWLAIEGEPVSIETLRENIVTPAAPSKFLEALKSLANRSLIEKNDGIFSQQPVVLEYMTERFTEQVCQEIETGQLAIFNRHILIKATAKDYIRETQIRLILKPIIDRLLMAFGNQSRLEQQLKEILSNLQQNSPLKPGYAAGNILNLLVYLQADLTSYNFSHLSVWQAFLRNVNLHQVNFDRSHLKNTVFTETIGSIFSVVFSPDGQFLATGDYSGKIHLWQVVDGQKSLTFNDRTDHLVRSVAFSPDGNILASGSVDRTVRLWNASTGDCLKILQGHEDWVNSIAFNPDGEILVTGSNDRAVKLWEVSTGKCRATLLGHADYVHAVAFSSQGVLASGSRDGEVRLWDVDNRECLAILKGHAKAVYAVAFSPNGSIIASGSSDFTIKLWDVKTRQCIATLQEHSNTVLSVTFSSDGQLLASAGNDKTVKLWDIREIENIRTVATLQGHTNWIRSVAFNRQGNILASGGADSTVKLWDIADVKNSRAITTWQGGANWIRSVAFSPDGRRLASASNDKLVRLWDVSEGKCVTTFQGHTDEVYSVAFSAEGEAIASGSGDCTVKLWDVKTGKCLTTLRGHQNRVLSVAFNRQSKVLASGSRDYTVKLWDTSDRTCLMTLPKDIQRVNVVVFSPDGEIIASGIFNGNVKLWEVRTGKCLATLAGHSRPINSLAFSPDGQILVSGDNNGTMHLWDTNNYQYPVVLQEHTNSVNSIAFSPKGDLIASGSGDKTVRLWDVSTHQCLTVLEGHDNWVYSVAFSPDGLILASGSADETIKLWDMTGRCVKTFSTPKFYEGMNIARVTGLTETTIATLRALGAVENEG